MTPYKLLSIVTAIILLSACTSENENFPVPEPADGVTITAKAVEMLPEVVMSRADGPEKSTEERKINRLHLFFFDSEGKFLVPNPKLENAISAYHIVDFGQSGANSINIPENAFAGHATLAGVQIVAIANPICDRPGCDHSNCSFRVEGINPAGDICHGDKADASAEKTITNLNDLLGWYYRPAERKDVTKLPEGGMPMFAQVKIEDDSKEIQLNMRSLMARVDVNVKLDASEKNGHSPTLKITGYVIKNLPDCVPFGGVNAGETSDVTFITEDKIVPVNEELADGLEAGVFTYYTYENIKNAKDNLPENVKKMPIEQQQRWKPTIADENASAFAMRGEYVDHQGIRYNAQFTVYLGSNETDNFEVKRNHCYKNNITISGLDNLSSNDGYVTFDGRVNVETFNEMYVSIINERYLDAHWCVIPMDIYFRDDTQSPECTVTIPDDCKAWVHLDHCRSEGMADNDFVAGWGCKDYFTTDMLENVVKETTATVTRSRDRIYFYLDENASTQARTARVELKYKSANEERTDHIELVQAGLIPFTYSGTTYYMEAYEEYTMHYDPLDPHGTTGRYDPEGIPWAAERTPQSKKAFSDGKLIAPIWWKPLELEWVWSPMDVIGDSDGQTICKYFMGIQTYPDYDVHPVQLNKIYPDELATAIGFACSKNKKSASSNEQYTNWFLPSIDQLGAMMTDPKTTNQNFREYYWSSNTARNPNRSGGNPVRGNENRYRARATKLDDSGNIVRSEINNTISGYPATTSDSDAASDYVSGDLTGSSPIISGDRDYSNVSWPIGGRTLRTQKLKVRAIRVADGVSTN